MYMYMLHYLRGKKLAYNLYAITCIVAYKAVSKHAQGSEAKKLLYCKDKLSWIYLFKVMINNKKEKKIMNVDQ